MGAVGMMGGYQVQRPLPAYSACPAQVAQVFGLLAKLLETGVIGQTHGRHGDLLSSPAVRYVRLKGGTMARLLTKSTPGGLSPVRGPEAPRTPLAHAIPASASAQARGYRPGSRPAAETARRS